MKRWVAAAIIAGLAVTVAVLLLPSAALAAPAEVWVTSQITSNSYDDTEPCVSGDRIAWERYDGTDMEIYTWLPAGGIVQLTNNTREDSDVRVSGDRVVWQGNDGHDFEIYTWTPSTGTVALTANGLNDTMPQVSGDRVTWREADAANYLEDVYTWTPSGGTVRVTTDGSCAQGPLVSGDRIAWVGSTGTLDGLLTWTPGTGIVKANTGGEWLSLSGDRISFDDTYGGGYNQFTEAATWTPTDGVVRITTNDYADNFTSTSGDRVTWDGAEPGGWTIYTWTPASGLVSVTGSTAGNGEPIVSGDRIVWPYRKSTGTASDEIAVWSPAGGIVKLTNNSTADESPDIDGDRVVWAHKDGSDYEIYTAVAYPVTVPAITSITPASAPAGGGATVVITGSGFLSMSGAAAVKFGTTNATSYTVDSPTQITAVAPAHAAGKVDVTVTAAGGTSSTTGAGDDFYYLTRYEQNDSHFAYTGTWAVSSISSASGGSFRYCDATGSATVSFTGTYLAWVAKTSPVYGKATVTLDEQAPVTVDLYSAATLYKKVVWSTGLLDSGLHTVKIEWTGAKNASATDYNIGVDAFDLLGTFTQALTLNRYEETAAALAYTGTWSTSTVASASGGTFKYANATGATVTVPFSGTSLSWIAKKSPSYGIAKVSVDGAAPVDVDLYDAGTVYGHSVWDSGKLTTGLHWVSIGWSGTKNASATDTNIGIDAVDVLGSLATATRVEQTDSHLAWAGSWTSSSSSSASGGSFKFADASGASVTIKFTGISLNLIAKMSSVYGIAQVKLDDQAPVTVDLYSSTTLYKQTVWKSGFLSPGDHTVVVTWTGTKRATATDYNVGLDAVDVIGALR